MIAIQSISSSSFVLSFFYFLCVCLITSNTCWARRARARGRASEIYESSESKEDNLCDHRQMTNYLKNISATHANTSELKSIGKSVEGRELWVMKISDNPKERPLLRPQVKFVGNVNGVSGTSCFILLRLIKHLLESFNTEGSIERSLLQKNEVHILPNINPDSLFRAIPGSCNGAEGRLNANGVAINRNFPYIFDDSENQTREPETKAIIKWIHENNFIVSTSLISGAWVVTYPFDSFPIEDTKPGEAHLTPDDPIFKNLASKYTATFREVPDAWYCPQLGREFQDGIINGAEWMPCKGTMMDYNYASGTFELMIGISCCRYENRSEVLESLWESNKEGLLTMIKQAESGVRGLIFDAETNITLSRSELRKKSQNYFENLNSHSAPWWSSKQGEFWRPLLPGKYILDINHEGYIEESIPFEVDVKTPTTLNIYMKKYYEPSTISSTIDTGENDLHIVSSEDPTKIEKINSIVISNEQRDHFMKQTDERDYHNIFGVTSSSTETTYFLYNFAFFILLNII